MTAITPPKRITFLGASTIAGKADREGGGFVQRFGAWYLKQHPGSSVSGFGVDGDTLPGMCGRVGEVIAPLAPDLIVISTGINDTRREGSAAAPNKSSIEDYRVAFAKLIQTAAAVSRTAVLGPFAIDDRLTQPLRGTSLYYSRQDAARYIAVQKEECAKQIISFRDLFRRWSDEELTHYLYRDGLHFGPAGHQALCEEMKVFLGQLE